MKTFISIFLSAAGVLFIAGMILYTAPVQSAPKGGTAGKPIPENVIKIAEKSCLYCHNKGGNPMAMEHVNLAKWDEYSAEKQASKAKDMCNMVTKDKMPPKSFREAHPDGVPSEEDIKTICNWAESLQVPKK